ncbi:hypothetical protein D5086_032540 [Populus alba]|uniref:Uncharacterized protein n=1 Tax=Populus alba TaxID=43335 RepID=A0ACC4ALU0_POPAL
MPLEAETSRAFQQQCKPCTIELANMLRSNARMATFLMNLPIKFERNCRSLKMEISHLQRIEVDPMKRVLVKLDVSLAVLSTVEASESDHGSEAEFEGLGRSKGFKNKLKLFLTIVTD